MVVEAWGKDWRGRMGASTELYACRLGIRGCRSSSALQHREKTALVGEWRSGVGVEMEWRGRGEGSAMSLGHTRALKPPMMAMSSRSFWMQVATCKLISWRYASSDHHESRG